MGTSPKNCALLGGNGKTLKLKTTAKLKDKRTLCHLPDPPLFSLQTTFKMMIIFVYDNSRQRLPLNLSSWYISIAYRSGYE
jgi:hypothetical protein